MKPSMLAKLDQLANRLVELDELLMHEGATSNMDSYRKMTREHAEIVKQNGGWVLKDKGSRYGTYVNGEAVTEHKLTHGDRVQFGAQVPEHLLEIGVVRAFTAQVFGQLAGLTFGGAMQVVKFLFVVAHI